MTSNPTTALDPIEITAGERDFATGLRALADLLDAAPDWKRDYDDYQHLICVSSRDEMIDAIKALGGKWEKHTAADGYFGMTRDLGNGVTCQVYAARANVCERRLVGTRTVTRVAPDAPTVEVEEDVYEWVCPPSILAEMGA